MLKNLLYLLAALLAAWTLACAALALDGVRDRLAPADVIVVPGNTIAPDGTPSPRLQARLDAALAAYRQGLAPHILVSGATGKEGFDEAASMAAYLRHHGVPASAVIEDSQGWTSGATAHNAAAIMASHGWRSAMVATQYFHVPRMRLALQRAGVQVSGQIHAPYVEWRDLYSLPREAAGFALYYLRSMQLT